MIRYPEAELWDELTYLAFHLHWSFGDLLDLEHRDRQRLVRQVAALDRRQRAGDTPPPTPRTATPPAPARQVIPTVPPAAARRVR